MYTGKIYIFTVLFFAALSFLLLFTVLAFFSFKQKIYLLRKEMEVIEKDINMQENRGIMLESDYALKSNSMRIKPLADRYLKTQFTNVKQLVNMKEMVMYNKQQRATSSSTLVYN